MIIILKCYKNERFMNYIQILIIIHTKNVNCIAEFPQLKEEYVNSSTKEKVLWMT